MLITYFKAQGGAGIVVDGFIRDAPRMQKIGVPLWVRGFTPNYASQATLFPWAFNVPIACSRVLVLPGDIMIADDDGAVVIPCKVAPEIARLTLEHEDWEAFSRMKITDGGALLKYYPLSDEGRQEYEAWRQRRKPERSTRMCISGIGHGFTTIGCLPVRRWIVTSASRIFAPS